jgi:hypothetical protein
MPTARRAACSVLRASARARAAPSRRTDST